MKVLRRIVHRGNAAHVSLPRQLMQQVRLQYGDAVIVELTERNTIEIRRMVPADAMTMSTPPPMNLDLAPVSEK